jgi:hypothetical protein
MLRTVKSPKQSTLDNLPNPHPRDAIEIIKEPPEEEIAITLIATSTGEVELTAKIAFMLPKRKAFSRVKSDLWFDRQHISSVSMRVLQGPLATDESEFTAVLDMRGVAAGQHILGVEMYGVWGGGEKLCRTIREVPLNYVPQTRAMRLVKIPSVRSVVGADLAVVSDSEKDIYRGIEKTVKKEHISKRDDW